MFVAFLWCGNLPAQRVIPVPQQVQQESGTFRITGDTKLYTNLKGAERGRLIAYLSSQPSFLNRKVYARNSAAGNAIFLQKLPVIAASSSEGYVLEVTAGGVTVSSATDTGLFYGLQTLLQLAEPAGENLWQVAAVKIEDAPRFDYRGLMIDVSRHFRTKEFLMKQMDALARYKINRLHLHLTDAAGWRIEIKNIPGLRSLPHGVRKRSGRSGGTPLMGASTVKGQTPPLMADIIRRMTYASWCAMPLTVISPLFPK